MVTAKSRLAHPGRLVVALTAVALLISVGTITIRSEPAPDASTTAAPAGPLKPPIQGLIDRQGIPPSSHFRAIQAFVVKANWSDLQPERAGLLVEDNAIDQALSQVRSLNAENPGLDLKIKLRVYAGIHAPEWAKSLDGPPLTVTNPENGIGGTVGRFWTDAFGRAYEDLQAKLAARYDQAPEVREVVITRCTTVFAEPFLRQLGDPATVAALLDAGFTPEADRRCHREQIDAHKVWARTRSDLAFNPYKVVSPHALDRRTFGRPTIDEDFTGDMMRYCRSVLGERCVLENNSIRWPTQPAYEGLYTSISALGPPIAFQTATKAKIGNLTQTLAWAVNQRANSVELFEGYDDYPTTLLMEFDRKLKANPVAGG